MASKLYGNFLLRALDKQVDWLADTIKVALVESTYTPDQDVDASYADISANEASGTGYTAGGATLANKSASYDGASNTVTLDGDDVTWANSTVTARYAVVYDDSGAVAADKTLIGYVDFGSNQSSSNGNFTIAWDATGIVRLTVA